MEENVQSRSGSRRHLVYLNERYTVQCTQYTQLVLSKLINLALLFLLCNLAWPSSATDC